MKINVLPLMLVASLVYARVRPHYNSGLARRLHHNHNPFNLRDSMSRHERSFPRQSLSLDLARSLQDDDMEKRQENYPPGTLWGPCFETSAGINSQIPCNEGQCVCKDDFYSQCRNQIDGSWAPDSTWKCQSPTGSQSSGGAVPSGTSQKEMTSTQPVASPQTTCGSSGGDSGPTPYDGAGPTQGNCGGVSGMEGYDGIASVTVSFKSVPFKSLLFKSPPDQH